MTSMVQTFKEIYDDDADVSATLISRVADQVLEQITHWQSRPLDPIYPIVYLDCIFTKIRTSPGETTRQSQPIWNAFTKVVQKSRPWQSWSALVSNRIGSTLRSPNHVLPIGSICVRCLITHQKFARRSIRQISLSLSTEWFAAQWCTESCFSVTNWSWRLFIWPSRKLRRNGPCRSRIGALP